MGTRAIYFFKDKNREVCGVYKHYDNYPSGAVDFIENAKEYAWEFPRFEADEFAAAFVAANKDKRGGGIRLLSLFDSTSIEMTMQEYMWCDYYYVITFDEERSKLMVNIFELTEDGWEDQGLLPHDLMTRGFKYNDWSEFSAALREQANG